jgi:hypothetical protein
MRFFRRNENVEVEPERCPVCTERVPEQTTECAMCGADLRALRPWAERGAGEPVEHK